MRLIDADSFKESIGTETKLRKMICSAIDTQPTAYDVEKVVEQLEEATVSGMGGVGFNKNVYEIIDIVKRGGME